MNERIRQMILGLGTFGTGTALLYLDVNPLLLVLTDAVVGVGMLFAAGSIKVGDLRIPRRGAPGGEPGTATAGPAAGGAEGVAASRGIRASLGRMGGSLRPAFGMIGKGKEEKEAEQKKIDLMLDSALVGQSGQSRRIISLAEGKGASTAAVAAALESPVSDQDLLQDLNGTDIPAQLLEEVSTEEDLANSGGTSAKPEVPAHGEIPSVSLPQPGEEETAEPQVDVLKLADGGTGADDLLSALRFEAMREKKKDDTSLLRDLRGVKVTGRQLLDELGDVLREMKGR
jgi:hypothetical protein